MFNLDMMNNSSSRITANDEQQYLKASYLDHFSDTLFSSVGVLATHTNSSAASSSIKLYNNNSYNNHTNSGSNPPTHNTAGGLMRCLSLSSLLDPNVDLPNISARDVDDVLSVSNNWKIKRESSLPSGGGGGGGGESRGGVVHPEFIGNNSDVVKVDSINVEDDDGKSEEEELVPLACRVDSFSDLFSSANEDLVMVVNDEATSSIMDNNVEVVEDVVEVEDEEDNDKESTSNHLAIEVIDDSNNVDFSTIVESTIYKSPADATMQDFNQTADLLRMHAGIIDDEEEEEEINVVQLDDDDMNVTKSSSLSYHHCDDGGGATTTSSFTGERSAGSDYGGCHDDSDDDITCRHHHPKRCTSAPMPFWQDDELMMNSLDDEMTATVSGSSATTLMNDSESTQHYQSCSSDGMIKPANVLIIREDDILKSEQLQHLFTKLKPIPYVIGNDLEQKRAHAQALLPSCSRVNFNTNYTTAVAMSSSCSSSSVVTGNSRKRKHSSSISVSDHLTINERFKYICPHHNCGKRFLMEERLNHHRTTYHSELLVNCSVETCHEKFANEKERKNHMEKCHPDKYFPYHCNECQLNFTRLAMFRKHKQYGHPRELHSCKHCGKIFISENRLEKHQRRHSEESILRCPYQHCNKSFLFAAHLNRHIKCKHTDNNDAEVAAARNINGGGGGCSSSSSVKLQTSSEELTQRLDASVNTPAVDSVEKRSVEVMHPDHDNKSVISPTLRVIYSCPIKDCNLPFDHQSEFHEHFVKHFTGEVPGDLNSLLPEDLPSTEDGMELPSMTFDANVGGMQGNQLMQEGSSLLDALDLILAETLDLSNKQSDSCSQQLSTIPDLTSALTLPALQPAGTQRNRQKTGAVVNQTQPAINKNQYSSNNRTKSMTNQNNTPSVAGTSNDQGRFNLQLTGCARTCPITNNVMSSLVRRRRALLRERITLGYEPLPLMDNQLALKDFMRQIFHSKELPVKYKDTHSELNQSLMKLE